MPARRRGCRGRRAERCSCPDLRALGKREPRTVASTCRRLAREQTALEPPGGRETSCNAVVVINVHASKTRKLYYRKDDLAMRLLYECPESF